MTKTIHIEGMSCGHCVAHVEEALRALPGVESVAVSLENKTAIIQTAQPVTDEALRTAIDEAGYEAVSIQ